ncbi:phytoene desaturase family protein [Lichenicola sp.]|uniref:phytoene desaturase family protein n=1 Tax=Lichenicola sp. TaxID=2804529 RepID=UPI003AFFF7D8
MAAALRARALGHEVTLVERLDQLGGRGRVFEREGFRFDAGPTVITAPFLLEELFALFGERLQDKVELRAVSPFYRMSFPDGRHFDYDGDAEAMRARVVAWSPGDGPGYDRLLAHAGRLYKIGYERYGAQPFHRLSTMLKSFPAILRLGGHRSVAAVVASALRDPALRRIFAVQPLLVGGHPFHTSGIYALIQHLERRFGVWFPVGGTAALVAALGELMQRHGITIMTGADVARITISDAPRHRPTRRLQRPARRAVTGIELSDGRRLAADIVIANADAPAIYAELLPKLARKVWTDRRLARLHYSMGLFVLYFGTNRRFPGTVHHTILLGTRWKSLLDEVFGREARLPEDASVYLHRPSATDPTIAPPGCDAFYVLAPVPNLQAPIDWAKAAPVMRDRVLQLLSERELPGLQSSITTSFWMTPQDFATDYRSMHGSGFSIAPRLMQSAWFRFHNRSEEVDGLYLVGAGTHPGAGLPGVLTSAKLVEGLLREKQRVSQP